MEVKGNRKLETRFTVSSVLLKYVVLLTTGYVPDKDICFVQVRNSFHWLYSAELWFVVILTLMYIVTLIGNCFEIKIFKKINICPAKWITGFAIILIAALWVPVILKIITCGNSGALLVEWSTIVLFIDTFASMALFYLCLVYCACKQARTDRCPGVLQDRKLFYPTSEPLRVLLTPQD